MNGSGISLCMIVRNEQDRVGRCIESVIELVDEIVVVDTGSSDQTVEIVKGFGAKVVQYAWNDDFAAARNAGLDTARNRWIFVLDADEQVARSDHAELRRMAASEPTVAYRFVTRNYGNNPSVAGWVPCSGDDPCARGFDGWHPSVKVRMFPNRPDIRFSGRVHELVRDSLDAASIPRVMSNVPIHHYGRTAAGLDKDKQLLYLELGRKKVNDDPDNPKPLFELGNILAEMGRTDEAAVQYETALKLAPESHHILAALGAIRYRQKRYPDAVRLFRSALAREPNLSETRRNLATALIANGKWDDARKELAELIVQDPAMYGVRFLQGVIEKELGNISKAVERFANELNLWPGNRHAAETMAEMAGAEPERAREIRAAAESLVNAHPDEPHLICLYGETLFHLGEIDSATKLFEQAADKDPSNARVLNNLGVAYFTRNRFADALVAFRKSLSLDPRNPLIRDNIRALEKKL